MTGQFVPIGGRLPHHIELPTGRLLDVLMDLSPKKPATTSQKALRAYRTEINRWLYRNTRPGLYHEITKDLHLAYADQRGGPGSQHYWRLFMSPGITERVERIAGMRVSSFGGEPQARTTTDGMTEWGGMFFRSQAEIKIAEALNAKGLLFFANVRGRRDLADLSLPVSETEVNGRMELDFMVIKHGHCFSLEVDGKHHQNGEQTTRDYARDRLLLREGVPTVRFTAQQCLSNPDAVVAEFLEIVRGHLELLTGEQPEPVVKPMNGHQVRLIDV